MGNAPFGRHAISSPALQHVLPIGRELCESHDQFFQIARNDITLNHYSFSSTSMGSNKIAASRNQSIAGLIMTDQEVHQPNCDQTIPTMVRRSELFARSTIPDQHAPGAAGRQLDTASHSRSRARSDLAISTSSRSSICTESREPRRRRLSYSNETTPLPTSRFARSRRPSPSRPRVLTWVLFHITKEWTVYVPTLTPRCHRRFHGSHGRSNSHRLSVTARKQDQAEVPRRSITAR